MNSIGKRKTYEEYREKYLGMKKGLLTVNEVSFEKGPRDDHKRTVLKGVCECGNSFTRAPGDFEKAKNPCCGRECQIRHPNLKGQRFGRLFVLDYENEEKSNSFFICQCDCGKLTVVSRFDLLSGKVKSCGCLEKENLKRISKQTRGNTQPGVRYGSLEVIRDSGKRMKGRQIIWECFCHECGKIYCFSTTDLYLGRKTHCGCKTETKSLGERTIEALLEANGINYVFQYAPDWSINPETKRSLLYDFFLPDYNCIIEYDGEQHFSPIKHFGGEDTLEKTQKRDNLKNYLCFEHGLSMIRIPNVHPHRLSFSDLMLSTSPYRINRREEYDSCK